MSESKSCAKRDSNNSSSPMNKKQLTLEKFGSNSHFPWKVHNLLRAMEAEGKQSIVSWLADGKSFRVHDREKFATEIMPLYFNSSNYRSFQRNLCLWGFKTVTRGPMKGVTTHVHFIRGDVARCRKIKRHALAAGHYEAAAGGEGITSSSTVPYGFPEGGVAAVSDRNESIHQVSQDESSDGVASGSLGTSDRSGQQAARRTSLLVGGGRITSSSSTLSNNADLVGALGLTAPNVPNMTFPSLAGGATPSPTASAASGLATLLALANLQHNNNGILNNITPSNSSSDNHHLQNLMLQVLINNSKASATPNVVPTGFGLPVSAALGSLPGSIAQAVQQLNTTEQSLRHQQLNLITQILSANAVQRDALAALEGIVSGPPSTRYTTQQQEKTSSNK